MQYLGACIGALLGARGGIWTSLAGALFGNWLETKLRAPKQPKTATAAAPVQARVADPFAQLDCFATDSDEVLRKAYHTRAKGLHPDLLRARGATEQEIARATENMARLNAAWAEIQRIRGIKG